MRSLLRKLATKILYALLHDWITRHTEQLFTLRDQLQDSKYELQELKMRAAKQEKRLNVTEAELASVNEDLISAVKALEKFRNHNESEEILKSNLEFSEYHKLSKEEWKKYLLFTAAMFAWPLIFFGPDLLLDTSNCNKNLEEIYKKVDCFAILRGHNIIALVGTGFLCAITYIINLSAPYRSDMTGSLKNRFKLLAERIPLWQFVIAIITGIGFSLGAYGVSNFTNLIGLCVALSLSTLPAVMSRPRL